MNMPVLNDPSVYPSPEVISSHLGETRVHWDALFSRMREEHPDFNEEWRYYNDGKSWLLKVTRKAKTVCWVSIMDGGFRATFYFPARMTGSLSESRISGALKERFLSPDDPRKNRGITVEFTADGHDLESARVLMALKETLK